jgi:hypothetical protein
MALYPNLTTLQYPFVPVARETVGLLLGKAEGSTGEFKILNGQTVATNAL